MWFKKYKHWQFCKYENPYYTKKNARFVSDSLSLSLSLEKCDSLFLRQIRS